MEIVKFAAYQANIAVTLYKLCHDHLLHYLSFHDALQVALGYEPWHFLGSATSAGHAQHEAQNLRIAATGCYTSTSHHEQHVRCARSPYKCQRHRAA